MTISMPIRFSYCKPYAKAHYHSVSKYYDDRSVLRAEWYSYKSTLLKSTLPNQENKYWSLKTHYAHLPEEEGNIIDREKNKCIADFFGVSCIEDLFEE